MQVRILSWRWFRCRDQVTTDEVGEHIEAGDILTWLSKRGRDLFHAPMFRDDGPYAGFEKFWVERLQSLQSAYGYWGRNGVPTHCLDERSLADR
jgi:hypothetical protein